MRTDLLPTLYLTLLASWLLLAAAQSAPASTRDRDLALRSARHHNANTRRGGKSPVAGDGPHSTHDGSSKPGQASGAQIPRPRSAADLVLTDIVLVTTVEGGIYGLDRATGSTIWEVPAHTASSAIPGEEPFAGFGPLVRSTYGPKRSSFVELLQGGAASSSGSYAGGLASPPTRPAYASDDDQGPNADAVALLEQVGIYVVEPSSAGDIYMLTPASPKSGASPGGDEQQGEGADPLSVPRTHLSKLPLTLPQLVQLSPFSFAGDDTRIFIGHKSTTLVELDIATGSIGAVWGGSSPDSAATNASFDDHSTHGHDQARRPWTYIGRTDYTLTIHARNRPALSQTLHFSTYAPTAADLDIQTIWAQAGHPDQRAVIGTGEQQTVVCFNTTSSASQAGAPAPTVAEDQDERTVWRTSIGGTVAGIFDIVQPSSVTARAEYHGSGTTATSKSPAPAAAASPVASSARYHAGGARPVIVPHPPISLSSLFGSSRQVSAGLGMPSSRRAGGFVNADDDDDDDDDDAERDPTEDENGQSPLFDLQSMGMSDSQRPAYLGFSGGSLFAMGSSKFPLAAFSPRAAAGLPGSTTADGPSDLPSGRPSPFEEFGRSDGADPNTGMSVRPCSAFGCWLGSYPVEVDAETDRNAQEALLGSARRPLGIADHHEAYDFWGVPSRSVPAIDAPPARSEGTGPERGSSSSSSSGPGMNSSLEEEEGEGGKRSGSKIPSLTTLLFQVIGLGCITLFSYALILGVNEQQRQNEERSNQLAEVVTLCDQDAPYMTEEQAGLQMIIDPKTGLPVLVMPEPETPPPAFASPSSVTATPQLKEKPLPATPITLEEMERARRMTEEDEAVAAELAKKKEEFQRLAQATDVNTLAAFIEQQQQQQQQNGAGSSSANGHSNLADNGRPTSSAGGGATPNGKSGPGGGGGKRRRRGKRAGAALAAKVAARAAAAGLDAGEGEDEEGDEDDTGEGSPPPAMLVNGRPSPPGSAGAGASGGGGKKGGALLLKQTSDRKSNGVRFLEQDVAGVKLPPNRLTATGLASASTLGAGAVAGADVFGTYPGPYSPTTTALLDGGWLQAGPDSQSAEEQLAKMAALASTPGSMRGPGSGGGGGNGDGRSEEIGMGIGIGNSGSVGRQVVSKSSGLTISDEVLGYGSSGTVVFKGTFQGRAVAVKRLLRDFVNVASKEVSLLESADNHPNVIRYFYKELTGSFLYIALELCPASLADVIDKPNEFRDLYNILEPKRALQQIASGVRHLHSLHIVHRDIKPQNILVAVMPNSKRLKMLLSDFGLSKRLDGLAQSSFSQTVNNPGGTVGWRAPEILRGDVQLDNGGGSESEQSSIGVASDGTRERGPAEERKRLTRAVDIFALGCVAYYVLANGEHPFGSRFEREMNIIRNCKNLSRLDGLGEEGVEAQHLINTMIAVEPRERPSASDVLSHPYFWDAGKRLNFLQEASDRFEIMERDPPAAPLVALEAQSVTVLGGEWYKKVDRAFVDDLGKFRKYDSRSVQDLLRALRNKKHHYQDLSPHLKKLLGPLPGGFLAYFTRRFPLLFMHVHSTLSSQSLIPHEAQFREYFEPNEHEH